MNNKSELSLEIEAHVNDSLENSSNPLVTLARFPTFSISSSTGLDCNNARNKYTTSSMCTQSEPSDAGDDKKNSEEAHVSSNTKPGRHLDFSGISATPDWAAFRTLLVGFPIRADTWRESAIPAQKAILSFVSKVLHHTHESAAIVTAPALPIQSQKLLKQFENAHQDEKRLSIVTLPMDDCWLRDTGPLFISSSRRDQLTGLCFRFNAWGGLDGGCYTDYTNDELLSKYICQTFDVPFTHVDMVLEGGSVSSDGLGTIITTEECLLNRNRNPHLCKIEIEHALSHYLGARKVIWLPFGAAYDDDTDGHVDNIAVFARPGHVVLAYGGCKEQRRRSTAAAHVLGRECDANGNRLTLHYVPVPSLRRTREEAGGVQKANLATPRSMGRICASYINFLICGKCVFVPRFGISEDEQAESVLRNVFKGSTVVMVNAREFVLAGGGLHCLTLGIPR